MTGAEVEITLKTIEKAGKAARKRYDNATVDEVKQAEKELLIARRLYRHALNMKGVRS